MTDLNPKALEAATMAVADLLLNPDGGEEALPGDIAKGAIRAFLDAEADARLAELTGQQHGTER